MNKVQKFLNALSISRTLSLDYLEKLITILQEDIEDVNSINHLV